MNNELSIIRGAMVVCLLADGEEVKTVDLASELGYVSGRRAVHLLMDSISQAQVPVYSPQRGSWALLTEDVGRKRFLD